MISRSTNSDEGNGAGNQSNSKGMNVHGDTFVGHEAHGKGNYYGNYYGNYNGNHNGNNNGNYSGNHSGNHKSRDNHVTTNRPGRNSPPRKNRLLNYQVHHQFASLKSNSNASSTVGNGTRESTGNHNSNHSHHHQCAKQVGATNQVVNHRSRAILSDCNVPCAVQCKGKSAQGGNQAEKQHVHPMQVSKMFNVQDAKLPDDMRLKTNYHQRGDERVSKQPLQPEKPVSEINIHKVVSSFKDQLNNHRVIENRSASAPEFIDNHANIIWTHNGIEIETSVNKSMDPIDPTQAKGSCTKQLQLFSTSTTTQVHTDSNTNNHVTLFSPISVTRKHDLQQEQQQSMINNDADITTENATIITPTHMPTTTKKKNKRRISFDEQNIVNTSLQSRKMNIIVDHDDDCHSCQKIHSDSNMDGILPFHPQLQNRIQQHDSYISGSNNTPNLKFTDLFVPDLTTTDLLHISRNEVTLKSLSREFESDDEESSSNTSAGDTLHCLPMPSFIQRLLSSKHKRRKLNSIEDVVKKLSVEYENRREKNHRNDSLRRDEERMKDMWVGDFGLTLFLPFDVDTFDCKANIDLVEEVSTIGHDVDLDSYLSLSDNESNSNESAVSECSFNEVIVDVEQEAEQIPNILSIDQMNEINRRGLPASVQLMTWKRAYSLRRDGDYFGTMFDKCCFFKHTLIVIKTIEGDIIGGYADTPWVEQKKSSSFQRSHSMTFFGSGHTFLFATSPDLTDEERTKELKARSTSRDKMYFYHWSGENDYNQIIDTERGLLGMGGGGGEFGFFIQRDFTVGSTGRSETFLNPPLVKSDGGNFKILDLEVYGFASMSERMSPNPYRSSMSYSSFGSIGKTSRNSSYGSFARQSSFSSSVTSIAS